jgi:hypothetical protein
MFSNTRAPRKLTLFLPILLYRRRSRHIRAPCRSRLRQRFALAPGHLRKRVGVSASGGNKTAFRHGYANQEVSTKLMTLCKRPPADAPTRFPLPAAHFERNDITLYARRRTRLPWIGILLESDQQAYEKPG